jgi:hypothetical protein
MPKVPDPDKILKAVMQNLKKSGVYDDVAKAGGNLADDISKIMSEMTGKAVKPAKPRLPKNPPKSGRATAAADDKYLRSKGKELLKEEKTIGTGNMGEDDLAILKLYKDGALSNKAPKNPPKSGRGKKPPAAGAVTPAPKGPKPKSPKSGSADAAEREARRQANRDNWAKEREAYNKMKAVEREERKAANRAKWAATLEEKYGGNIVDARKATSKGRNKNKKDKK